MLLIDTGAIAEMKRRMQGAADPPSPLQPMPQAPIQAPPLLAPPPQPSFPMAEEAAPIRSISRGERLQNSLFGQAELPSEMQPFFKPSEQQALRPGLLSTLTNSLIGGYSRGEVMKNRALMALDEKDALAKRNDAATLKEQMAALRQKYANGGGDFRSFAAELAMLRPELSAQLAGMVNAMEPPRAVNPPSAPALQREDNVLGEDGKPYIVWTDAQGKEVKRERQYVAPQTPREDNTIVPVLDPADPEKKRVIYVPRAQAVGMERPSAGAGGINGQAVTNRLVAENDKQIGVIDSALSELRKYPKAVGMNRGLGLVPGMGNFADEFNQRRDPEGVKLRALIANISSLKIKDRSGAAVTISEFPRLVPFIPLVTNTPEAIKTKLEQLKAEIARHNKELREESGGGSAAKVPSYEEWLAGRKK